MLRKIFFLGIFMATTSITAADATPSAASPVARSSAFTVDFEIRDAKTKEIYFKGQEKTSLDGKLIRKEAFYFDTAQNQVQKEIFVFDASTLQTLTYDSTSATGEETNLTAKNQTYEMKYRPNQEGKTGNAVISEAKGVYVPKAANELIQQNWDSLLAGKALKFELVVPSRLEAIPFQIVHRESKTVDGEAREVFSLIPQNVLIRMLAPHLEFQFNKDKRIRMAFYPSPLPVKGTKDKMVEMIFKE